MACQWVSAGEEPASGCSIDMSGLSELHDEAGITAGWDRRPPPTWSRRREKPSRRPNSTCIEEPTPPIRARLRCAVLNPLTMDGRGVAAAPSRCSSQLIAVGARRVTRDQSERSDHGRSGAVADPR